MFKLSKRWKARLITLVSIILMVATIPAAIWITHSASAELGNARARCERVEHAAHRVIIQNDKVLPAHVEAKKCDSLTIVNQDNQQRLIAFGRHDNHISYDGVSEKLLNQGQNLTVTLVRPGTYLFHDHEDPAVAGTFTVEDTATNPAY